MYLADKIKFLRKEKGYTQVEMAKLIGVSQQEFNKWETGAREPNLQTIAKIARFFSGSLDDLILKEMTPQKPLYIKNLIWLRKSRGLMQEEMAKFLGYSNTSAISKAESCTSEVSVENLIRLADFYEVSLDDLVKKDLSKEEI